MIAEIRLQQYRSYLDKTFKLKSGVNIVIGPNGSGKTNLLEAIMVICQGSSFRASDSELTAHTKDWSRIDAITNSGETRTVKITGGPKTSKDFVLNNKSLKRLSLANQIPLVLFEPNHLLLLSGSPELRRTYLDEILDQIKPGYKKTKNDYLKTLRHRNALLKSDRVNKNDIFPWNVRLAQLGGYISATRADLVEELGQQIKTTYRLLSNDKTLTNLIYKQALKADQYESQLLKTLEDSFALDVMRGFTSSGPHREDMEVLVNDKPALSVASRGEARTLIIALKIIELETMERQLGKKPVFLLDDVFSELDERRRKTLTEKIYGLQVLLTTTNGDSYQQTTSKPNTIKLISKDIG